MKNNTQNNDCNIYEKNHSGNFLLFAFVNTIHWQPLKATSQKQKIFKMFPDEMSSVY